MKTLILIIFSLIACVNVLIAEVNSPVLNNSNPSPVAKGDSVVTATFSISNLGCGSDAANMQKAILQTKGVKQCVVSSQKGSAIIKYDAAKVTKDELVSVIENCSLCHDKNAKPFKVTGVK